MAPAKSVSPLSFNAAPANVSKKRGNWPQLYTTLPFPIQMRVAPAKSVALRSLNAALASASPRRGNVTDTTIAETTLTRMVVTKSSALTSSSHVTTADASRSCGNATSTMIVEITRMKSM